MPFGRKSPLEALALPGVLLAYKYSQFQQRRREAASRRVTERELSALHHKIDKLLSRLEESEPEPPTSQEDECVICINARATMQTSPCGHRVVCRKCFVKTIQSAVAQRMLPLRCVICRARVNRLTSSSGTWRIQESASTYSVGSKSWISSNGVSKSLSFNSVTDNPNRFKQSASLFSMSSGVSCVSGVSNGTNFSTKSSLSSGGESSSGSCSRNGSVNYPHQHIHNHPQLRQQHSHPHSSCASGCLGAIPRKTSLSYNSITNTYPDRRYTKNRIADLQNRLPPIKEFRSPAKVPTPSPVHLTDPRLRYASYTKNEKGHESDQLLLNIRNKTPSITRVSSKQGLTSKVAPVASKMALKKNILTEGSSRSEPFSSMKNFLKVKQSGKITSSNCLPATHFNQDEKVDNKKNENVERKKKEEKLKIKAEKEARKEEKRLAKEEEKLAKFLAKEEKRKCRKEAKELLLGGECSKK